MIRSMTGYGRAQDTVDNMEIVAEIKAVNHRYFEFSCRIHRQFGFLDEKVKQFINKCVIRGKVEVYISINQLENCTTQVEINHPLALAYINAFKEMNEKYDLNGNVSVKDIIRFPDVLTIKKSEEDEEKIFNAVQQVLGQALDSFITMRENEGEKLKIDVVSRCNNILKSIEIIKANSKETEKLYRERLELKIRELLDDTQVDQQRLLTETAIFADKIAVDEETVRLTSHIEQLKTMLESNQPQDNKAIGRKIDFLIQEMNRETNTIGSKAFNLEITGLVVEIKSEIEKIREQIQNIE